MILNFIKSSYKKVKDAFVKTGSFLGTKLRVLFAKEIDEDTLEQLEELFYEADLGMQTASELTKKVRILHKQNPELGPDGIINAIKADLISMLSTKSTDLNFAPKDKSPTIFLVVGVNGNGKTTSVAKLAKQFQDANLNVIIAAADTFRAAAVEQLDIWSKRLNIELVKGNPKGDPSSVAYDAIAKAKAQKSDVVLIDTAGRLHTKTHLMQELEKIKRTCQKLVPEGPHEILLVLDATTGQNAVDQAKTFHQFTPISGLILTKLDGTAKGGVVINIYRQLGIPVKFIGVGEGIEDLEPFNPTQFVQTLFEG